MRRWILVALFLTGFGLLCYISLVVFRNHPFSLDEYNYLYQAEIFSSGHISLHFNKDLLALFEKHTVFVNGNLFSKYPPGFSFILVPGVKLGVPGLINPLLSSAALVLIYLMADQLVGSLYALFAALLIISNSYFLGYAASYFSQPSSMFLLSLTLFLYLRYKIIQKTQYLFAAALAVSCATIVRP